MIEGQVYPPYGMFTRIRVNGSNCIPCKLRKTDACRTCDCEDGHFVDAPKKRKRIKPIGPTYASVLKKLAQGARLIRRMRDIELNTGGLDDADRAFIIKLGQRK